MAEVRAQRRLAAILVADIVGYSRLIEADEAGTLAATMRSLRAEVIDPQVALYNGRIFKLLGDGAIVEFASVVDAVACAVTIQKAVALAFGGDLKQAEHEFERALNLNPNSADVLTRYAFWSKLSESSNSAQNWPNGRCGWIPTHRHGHFDSRVRHCFGAGTEKKRFGSDKKFQKKCSPMATT